MTRNWLIVAFVIVLLGCTFPPLPSIFTESSLTSIARTEFEKFAKQGGVPYQNVQVNVVKNDGTFATVQIVAEFRDTPSSQWIQKESTTDCRKVGNEWQCNPLKPFMLTPKSIANVTAIAQARYAKLKKLGRIVFTSQAFEDRGGIYVVDADGENLRRITNNRNDSNVVWSPDGHKVAFWSSEGNTRGIYVQDVDTGNRKRIADFLGYTGWSPDSSKIAIYSEDRRYPGIYITDADGGNQHQVTNDSPQSGSELSWSPDGHKIIFITTRNGKADVYVMDTDGTNQRRLTNGFNTANNPMWSPDGRMIAFTTPRKDNLGNWIAAVLWSIDFNGGTQRQLISDLQWKSDFAWSPDGHKIAFVSNRNYDSNIYVIDADGTNQRKLTSGNSFLSNPIWSSDGEWIAFIDGGGITISRVNGETTFLLLDKGILYDNVPTPGTGFDWSRIPQ
jgi:Tol biopolymer transport system component